MASFHSVPKTHPSPGEQPRSYPGGFGRAGTTRTPSSSARSLALLTRVGDGPVGEEERGAGSAAVVVGADVGTEGGVAGVVGDEVRLGRILASRVSGNEAPVVGSSAPSPT